jgi:ribosome-binding protein aMBF1 (putative translation factor)
MRRADETLDTSYHGRRLERRLSDPEFRAEYERARQEIRQIDEIMQQLNTLREEAGVSKADLARQIGKHPAAIRRLFTAAANPELKTVAAIATALDAEIRIVTKSGRARAARPRSALS